MEEDYNQVNKGCGEVRKVGLVEDQGKGCGEEVM